MRACELDAEFEVCLPRTYSHDRKLPDRFVVRRRRTGIAELKVRAFSRFVARRLTEPSEARD